MTARSPASPGTSGERRQPFYPTGVGHYRNPDLTGKTIRVDEVFLTYIQWGAGSPFIWWSSPLTGNGTGHELIKRTQAPAVEHRHGEAQRWFTNVSPRGNRAGRCGCCKTTVGDPHTHFTPVPPQTVPNATKALPPRPPNPRVSIQFRRFIAGDNGPISRPAHRKATSSGPSSWDETI